MAEELENRTTASMLGILRASLFTGEDLPVPEWEPVFEEMKAQTVAALPARWLPHQIGAAQRHIRVS